uniref:RNase H type-1 domain-containing protein n=1 Tax=Brassica oleracea var. oleracea TaxID=109376 RepID=A0A0D3DK00_BRAOL
MMHPYIIKGIARISPQKLGYIVGYYITNSTSLFVASPLVAESLAVLSAINSALALRIDSITIFSDSQVLINTINKKGMKLEIYNALRDIYSLSTTFKSIVFKFIPRSSNNSADLLAKQALWTLSPL